MRATMRPTYTHTTTITRTIIRSTWVGTCTRWQSVTKSVAATVIGAAISRGEIAGVEAPPLSFLDDYDLSGMDPRLRRASLEDLLTMRSGIEWHEQDRPLDEYADRHLFGPLGIRDYHWKKTPAGLPDTEGGLYLEALQLAKIAYLYLHDGVWDGARILPEGRVATATAKQVENVNPDGWGYGYQWWRLDRGETVIWAGLGFGGQYLLVLPQDDPIGVVNSWNPFGAPRAGILGALVQALIDSAN